MEEDPLAKSIEVLSSFTTEIQPEILRQQFEYLLKPYSDQQIRSALQIVRQEESPNEANGTESIGDENPDIAFRRDEFNVLRIPREDGQLLTAKADLEQYEDFVRTHFSNVILIHKLRETRAFAGFTRVYPHDGTDLEDRKSYCAGDFLRGKGTGYCLCSVWGRNLY